MIKVARLLNTQAGLQDDDAGVLTLYRGRLSSWQKRM